MLGPRRERLPVAPTSPRKTPRRAAAAASAAAADADAADVADEDAEGRAAGPGMRRAVGSRLQDPRSMAMALKASKSVSPRRRAIDMA